MDLWTALAILGRRWRTVVAGLLLTVAGLVAVSTAVAVTYRAEGEVIFILPAQEVSDDTTDIGLQNPYLGFGGSLNVMTFVVARAAGGQQAAREIEQAGGTADFVVDVVAGDAPMLSVEATSRDADLAMRTYAAARRFVLDELESRQATVGAPQSLRIVGADVRVPLEAEPQYGSLLRAAAAVVVLGVAGTLATAFGTESIAVHRRDRRGQHAGGTPPTPSDLGGDDDAVVPEDEAAHPARHDGGAVLPTPASELEAIDPQPAPLAPVASEPAADAGEDQVPAQDRAAVVTA